MENVQNWTGKDYTMNDTREYGMPQSKEVGDIERLLRATSAVRTALNEVAKTCINKGIIVDNDICPDCIYNTLERGVMRLIASQLTTTITNEKR